MCKRCGECCKRGPCIIDSKLKNIIKDKYKFKRDEVHVLEWRPLFNTKGVCKYLKIDNGVHTCPIMEQYQEFKQWMNTGRCPGIMF